MSAALLSARSLLAVVFAVAAGGKILDLEGSRQALEDFNVPERLARVGGLALPGAELPVAVLLLIRPLAVVGATGALLLLAAFIAGVVYAMRHDLTPNCHCFGQLHSEPAGAPTLFRNLLLAAPAAFVVVAGPGPSLQSGVGGLRGAQIGLVATAALAAALAVLTAQFWSDRRRLGRELERSIASKAPAGLPRGSQAPPFELMAARGALGSLTDLLALSRPVVLVFLSTSCGPCLGMLPLLAGWQTSLSEAVVIPAIFSGELQDVEKLVEQHELGLALVQTGAEPFRSYALRATPSAVLLGRDGVISATPAEGVPAIEALVRSAVAATGPVFAVHHA
jgi:thiol-disulfide isomerase/thioredoxin